MIIEGGRKKYLFELQRGTIVFAWLLDFLRRILFLNSGSGLFRLWLILIVVIASHPVSKAQNCDVDFPGTSIKTYSTSCGVGGASANMTIGKNVHLDTGDEFTFEAPSVINIQGNLDIIARGDGVIIIPAGVTVIVDGHVRFKNQNGCDSGEPCSVTFIVLGTLQVAGGLRNDILSLVWEGTGTVEVKGKLENSSSGCMYCGLTCPNFPAGAGCSDSGVGCTGDFCANYGAACLIDVTDPVISNCPSDISISASSTSCDAVVTWTPPVASDNCKLASFTSNYKPGDTFPVGQTKVLYTATDEKGNSSECTFVVEVIDDTDPIITGCPEDIVLSASSCANTPVNWIPPSVSDNCKVISLSSSYVPGQTFPLGISTVTYTARDSSGNSASCSFQVELIDDVSPVISSCPSNLTVTAPDNSCDAVVNWAPPTVADNCNEVTLASTNNPGDTFAVGITTVTYTATDDYGNVAICSFDIEVLDSTAPVMAGCLSNISLTASSCTGAVANWVPPTAADNCSLQSFTSSHSPGDTFPLGLTTVTYTATDISGNINTCSFQIDVVDDVGPVITGCPTDMVIGATDCNNATVNWIPPTASDNCNVASFTSSHDPGDVFPLGITTVTYTATDDNGNTTNCSFLVELVDNTSPVISNCPGDINVSTTGVDCDAIVSWTPPTAADNCTLLSFNGSHRSGDLFSVGSTTVTYNATDESGNSSSCSFNIIVSDQQPPQITNCPADILVPRFDPGDNMATVSWNEPAVDDCSVAVISSTHKPGDKFPEGQTVVTYQATDESGNQQICSFTVEVMGNNSPMADNINAQTNSSESIQLCFDASDSDGDALVLGDIEFDGSLGSVDQVDQLNQCFIYTPSLGVTGLAVVTGTICDDKNPAACIKVQAEIEILSEEINVYKAFSPNGDGVNDLWQIGNIEQYPENSVIIFDRWGSIIYEVHGYNNENLVWDGRGNRKGTSPGAVLPSGTYFYSIKLHGNSSKTGYVEIIN